MSHATELQKAAARAQAHLQHQTAKATPAIAAAKASSQTTVKALKKLLNSKNRLRFAKHQVRSIKKAIAAIKTVVQNAKSTAEVEAEEGIPLVKGLRTPDWANSCETWPS